MFADTSPGSLQPVSEDFLLDALSEDFTVPSATSSPVSLLRALVASLFRVAEISGNL